ncbi:MAG: YtxH domain-containing protein [Chloroflexota bacterium]
MASDNSGSGFGTGLILGGIIGALAGLLLAPRLGEETRAQVMERTAELRHVAEELTAEARERLREAIEEGRTMVSRMRAGREGDSTEEPLSANREEPVS